MVHCAWRAPGGKPLTSRVVRNHCCARHQNTPPRDQACAAAAAFWGVGSLTDGKLFSEYFCHHSRLIQRKEKQICCLLDFVILKMSMLLGWLAAALKKPVTLSHHIKPWETVMMDFLFIYLFFFFYIFWHPISNYKVRNLYLSVCYLHISSRAIRPIYFTLCRFDAEGMRKRNV